MEVFSIPSHSLRVDPGVLHDSIRVKTLVHPALTLRAAIYVEEACIVTRNAAIPIIVALTCIDFIDLSPLISPVLPRPAILTDIIQQPHHIMAIVICLRHKTCNTEALNLSKFKAIEVLIRGDTRFGTVMKG